MKAIIAYYILMEYHSNIIVHSCFKFLKESIGAEKYNDLVNLIRKILIQQKGSQVFQCQACKARDIL